MKQATALKLVKDELKRATSAHGVFASAHEGYAVLLEEMDELWNEVKANRAASHRGVSEAVQVAAMALRFLMDVCPEDAATPHTVKAESYFFSSGSYGGYSG